MESGKLNSCATIKLLKKLDGLVLLILPIVNLKTVKNIKMAQENINEVLNKLLDEKNRPTGITVICILGFIGAASFNQLIFSDLADQIGSWCPPYLGLSAIIGIMCLVGLWQMKKWAVYTYTWFVGLNQIVLLVMGVWNVAALIIPVMVVGIALAHLKKMD